MPATSAGRSRPPATCPPCTATISGILGCGFCKLWVTDGFVDFVIGIEKPDFTAFEE